MKEGRKGRMDEGREGGRKAHKQEFPQVFADFTGPHFSPVTEGSELTNSQIFPSPVGTRPPKGK